jgi:bile acid:Na+ symporter, BASS family
LSPFKIVALIVLVSLMLSTGLQANRERLAAILKNYGLLSRALLANFIIIPVVGFLAVRLFQLDADIATGLLLMAIAPGVPFVVLAGGRGKGGSLGFAIALAFIMPALSVLTVPITAKLVFPASEVTHLSLTQVLVQLVLFQLVPLLVGILIAARAPTLGAKLARPFNFIAILSLVALVVLIAPTMAKSVAVVFGSRGLLADLCVVVLSVVAGWLLGGPEAEFRRTLAIGTALRNIGLCALLATTFFPGTLVIQAVMAYLFVQIIVAAIVGSYFKRTSTRAVSAQV